MTDRVLPTSWTRVWIREESDVWEARRQVREACRREGCSEAVTEALVIAVSEVSRNIVLHAGSGELELGTVLHEGRPGIVVRAHDRGPGIADLEAAMTDGYSSAAGLGLGLPSAKRMVDDFQIESTPGSGSTITMWKWVARERA